MKFPKNVTLDEEVIKVIERLAADQDRSFSYIANEILKKELEITEDK